MPRTVTNLARADRRSVARLVCLPSIALASAGLALSACGLHVSKHGVSGNIMGHSFSAASGSLPAGFPGGVPVPAGARVLGGGGTNGRWDVSFAATGSATVGASAYQERFRSDGYTITDAQAGSAPISPTGSAGTATSTTVTVTGSVFTARSPSWTVEVEAGSSTSPTIGSLKAGEYAVNVTVVPTSSVTPTTG
jgi:hypothetical protein